MTTEELTVTVAEITRETRKTLEPFLEESLKEICMKEEVRQVVAEMMRQMCVIMSAHTGDVVIKTLAQVLEFED